MKAVIVRCGRRLQQFTKIISSQTLLILLTCPRGYGHEQGGLQSVATLIQAPAMVHVTILLAAFQTMLPNQDRVFLDEACNSRCGWRLQHS